MSTLGNYCWRSFPGPCYIFKQTCPALYIALFSAIPLTLWQVLWKIFAEKVYFSAKNSYFCWSVLLLANIFDGPRNFLKRFSSVGETFSLIVDHFKQQSWFQKIKVLKLCINYHLIYFFWGQWLLQEWTTMRSIKRNMLTLNLRAISKRNEAKYSIWNLNCLELICAPAWCDLLFNNSSEGQRKRERGEGGREGERERGMEKCFTIK